MFLQESLQSLADGKKWADELTGPIFFHMVKLLLWSGNWICRK